ncbi:Zinc finger/thioredoxin putative domain-containing protein [Comamonas aquatilis]|uniref:zinc-ribbon and DUF3426 domain-containing protein n=1 Tax=Comamonas aquatilis TaxID=1778406 RepID=UPI0039EE82C0
MSQVTRCPSCDTRFKVVADQLRISQGWVRCGVCQNVFDACEDLQTWDETALPAPLNAQQAEPQQLAAEAGVASSEQADERADERVVAIENIASSVHQEKALPEFDSLPASAKTETLEVATQDELHASVPDAAAAVPESEVHAQTHAAVPTQHLQESYEPVLGDQAWPLSHATSIAAAPSVADVDALPDWGEAASDDMRKPADVQDAAAAAPDASDPAVSADAALMQQQFKTVLTDDRGAVDTDDERNAPVDTAPSLDAAEPGFVRQARRQAFWHSAAVRAVLLLGSLLAVVALAAQYAWQQRDALAAQYPGLRPPLGVLCKAAGCQLQPRREIADVVISSSGFKQLANTDANTYQWSLSLENRSSVAVAMPMAELTLTDAQDKPLLRRVIDLQPLGAPLQLLPGQEWSASISVQVQPLSAPVAGYRALVFYP